MARDGTQGRTHEGRDIINGVVDNTASLKAVSDEWFAQRIERRYRRPKQIRQYLDRIPAGLLTRPMHEIDRLEVSPALQHYARTHGPMGANRLLAIMKQV